MYRLTKKFKAEIAHRLPYHDGKCESLHGHQLDIIIFTEGKNLVKDGPKQGFLVDYGDISKVVKPMIEEFFDHHYLNESIDIENPSSENLCKWVYDRLKSQLPLLKAIEIGETRDSSCYYEPDIE